MLHNLAKTLETCIDYHAKQGDTDKAQQLQQHLDKAKSTKLFAPIPKEDYIYRDEGAK